MPVDPKTLAFDEGGLLTVKPTTAPGANQFLTKDGSGALVWATPSMANVGTVTLGAQAPLGLGTFTNAQETTLTGGLVMGDKGKTWFNTDIGQLRYWNGSAPQTLGTAGAGLQSLGGLTANDQLLAADTAGTTLGFTHAVDTHTLHLPLAATAGVTAGLVSNAELTGKVDGPASATDDALVRFDGTTGKLVQSGTATLDDAGQLAATSATGVAGKFVYTGATTQTTTALQAKGGIEVEGGAADAGSTLFLKGNATDGQPSQIYTGYWGATEPALILGTYSQRGSQLVLTPSGDVGIGTTTPGARLDVNGTLKATSLVTTGSSSSPGAGTGSERYGAGAAAAGNYGVALGNSASASGLTAVAVGYNAVASNVSGVALGASANSGSSNTIAVGNGASASGGDAFAIGSAAGATGNAALAIGVNSQATATGAIALGDQAVASTANTFVAGSGTYPVDNVFFGKGRTSGTPTAWTLNGTGGSGTDVAGGALQLAGGKSTGNAAGGAIAFSTAPAGASGAGVNAPVERMRIAANGYVGIGTAAPALPLSLQTSGTDSMHIGFYDNTGADAGSVGMASNPVGTTRGLWLRAPDVTGAGGNVADNWVTLRFNGSTNKVYFGDTGATSLLQSGHALLIKANRGSGPDGTVTPDLAISSGKVGLGTASPTTQLSLVYNDTSYPNGVSLKNDGSAGTPTYNIGIGTASSGMDGGFSIWRGSTVQLGLDASGDLVTAGIIYGKSSAEMQLQSTQTTTGAGNTAISLGNGGGAGGLRWTSGTGDLVRIGEGTTANSGTFNPSSGTAKIQFLNVKGVVNQSGTATGNYTGLNVDVTETSFLGTDGRLIDASVGGASKFVVKSTGRVGIGTTSPNALLHVESAAISGDTELARIGAAGSAAGIGYLTLGSTLGLSGYVGYDYGNAGVSINAHGAGGGPGGIFVKKFDSSRSYVGIGTVSPAAELDVNGRIKSTMARAQVTANSTWSTTSTSWVDTDMTATVTSTGGPLLLMFTSQAMTDTASGILGMRFVVDGTAVTAAAYGNAMVQNPPGATTYQQNMAAQWLATGLSAGSHTIKVQVRTSVGTGYLNEGPTESSDRTLTIIEL